MSHESLKKKTVILIINLLYSDNDTLFNWKLFIYVLNRATS